MSSNNENYYNSENGNGTSDDNYEPRFRIAEMTELKHVDMEVKELIYRASIGLYELIKDDYIEAPFDLYTSEPIRFDFLKDYLTKKMSVLLDIARHSEHLKKLHHTYDTTEGRTNNDDKSNLFGIFMNTLREINGIYIDILMKDEKYESLKEQILYLYSGVNTDIFNGSNKLNVPLNTTLQNNQFYIESHTDTYIQITVPLTSKYIIPILNLPDMKFKELFGEDINTGDEQEIFFFDINRDLSITKKGNEKTKYILPALPDNAFTSDIIKVNDYNKAIRTILNDKCSIYTKPDIASDIVIDANILTRSPVVIYSLLGIDSQNPLFINLRPIKEIVIPYIITPILRNLDNYSYSNVLNVLVLMRYIVKCIMGLIDTELYDKFIDKLNTVNGVNISFTKLRDEFNTPQIIRHIYNPNLILINGFVLTGGNTKRKRLTRGSSKKTKKGYMYDKHK